MFILNKLTELLRERWLSSSDLIVEYHASPSLFAPRPFTTRDTEMANGRASLINFSVALWLGVSVVRLCSAGDFHERGPLFHTCRPRLVNAERFLVEIVAGGSVGTRAATHTDIAKLAAAAFSLEIIDIAKLIKHHRVFPDICERLLFQIASQRRQVSTGINFALVRDETNGGSSQASLGHGIHVRRMSSRVTHCVPDPMRFQFDSS